MRLVGIALNVPLLVSAFAFGMAQYLAGWDATAFGPGHEVVAVMRSLVTRAEFADPYLQPTGPTAHVAPVYVAILALIFSVLPEPGALLAAVVFSSACLALTCAILPALAEEIFGSSQPGLAAAVLLMAASRIAAQVEAFLSALLLILVFIFALRPRRRSSGIVMGAALLTNPAVLFACFPLIRMRWSIAVIAIGITMPWVARNWLVLGEPSFVRNNLGLELWLSNHDDADAELSRNRTRLAQHPSYNRTEAQRVAEVGETRYQRQKMSQAAAWISDHPARFARLCLRRVVRYWWPSLDEGWQAAAMCALTPLGILAWWRRRACRHSTTLVLCLLLASLPFVIVQTDNRYRYPTLWANALLAGALFGPVRHTAPGPAD